MVFLIIDSLQRQNRRNILPIDNQDLGAHTIYDGTTVKLTGSKKCDAILMVYGMHIQMVYT